VTTAGEAVLGVAYVEVGVTEDPPGSNQVKYWDPWGGSLGPWCAAFVSWCHAQAGYPPCPVEGPQGFALVSAGTAHGYGTGGDGATGLEAQRTLDLQPGDTVLFSWEPWEFRGGVPTCVGEWDGYVAGDHTGLFAYWVDEAAGRFAAVEGNTSQSSWDNGGAVMLREDRYTSQVCGWWRMESVAGGGEQTEDEMTEADFARIEGIVNTAVANVWRAQEMAEIDQNRAQVGGQRALQSADTRIVLLQQGQEAATNVMRSEENAAIIEAACRRAIE
jgi:hypothetical protein